jgi:hypothetical protein
MHATRTWPIEACFSQHSSRRLGSARSVGGVCPLIVLEAALVPPRPPSPKQPALRAADLPPMHTLSQPPALEHLERSFIEGSRAFDELCRVLAAAGQLPLEAAPSVLAGFLRDFEGVLEHEPPLPPTIVLARRF